MWGSLRQVRQEEIQLEASSSGGAEETETGGEQGESGAGAGRWEAVRRFGLKHAV